MIVDVRQEGYQYTVVIKRGFEVIPIDTVDSKQRAHAYADRISSMLRCGKCRYWRGSAGDHRALCRLNDHIEPLATVAACDEWMPREGR